MNSGLVICASLIVFPAVSGQIQYASRIRNLSIESETDAAYIMESKIYRDKNEHKVAVTVNVTKDFHIKVIEVILYRCSFEISDCENFQRWRFTHRLRDIVYMKNQMWTPIFENITPKLDIPHVKKNIYYTPEANLNPNAIVTWYPEVVNYFWRAHVLLSDYNDKKAFIMKLELSIFTFVERNKKKNRGGTRTVNNTGRNRNDTVA